MDDYRINTVGKRAITDLWRIFDRNLNITVHGKYQTPPYRYRAYAHISEN